MLRTLRSPSGREWKVSVYDVPSGSVVLLAGSSAEVKRILCFEAPDIILELTEFPENWAELSESALVGLLGKATVPSVVVSRPYPSLRRIGEAPVRH